MTSSPDINPQLQLEGYHLYHMEVSKIMHDALRSGALTDNNTRKIDNILNGESHEKLTQYIPISIRKADGIFFTGSEMAAQALDPILKLIKERSKVVDINCGSGDLLLSIANILPLKKSLETTLKSWGKILYGQDIYSEFVELAKKRIVLTAMVRLNRFDLDPSHINSLLPNIVQNDSMQHNSTIKESTHIVINPPYYKLTAPDNCNWASGKVNSAAVFLEKCVMNAVAGTRIVAILPDVLRSGTLYTKWRNHIATHTEEKRIKLMGKFRKDVDVDVFLLDLVKKQEVVSSRVRWGMPMARPRQTVNNFFKVHIGKVVDYRAPHKGKSVDFIVPQDVDAWETIKTISKKRKFKGGLIIPPFVVIRRTSRKEDKFRATASIIDTKKPVAIENHFIVLKPRNGGLKKCHELLNVLKSSKTNKWLNNRIRCRHLTKSAVELIPWT